MVVQDGGDESVVTARADETIEAVAPWINTLVERPEWSKTDLVEQALARLYLRDASDKERATYDNL